MQVKRCTTTATSTVAATTANTFAFSCNGYHVRLGRIRLCTLQCQLAYFARIRASKLNGVLYIFILVNGSLKRRCTFCSIIAKRSWSFVHTHSDISSRITPWMLVGSCLRGLTGAQGRLRKERRDMDIITTVHRMSLNRSNLSCLQRGVIIFLDIRRGLPKFH